MGLANIGNMYDRRDVIYWMAFKSGDSKVTYKGPWSLHFE